jgi:hypothetical protein
LGAFFVLVICLTLFIIFTVSRGTGYSEGEEFTDKVEKGIWQRDLLVYFPESLRRRAKIFIYTIFSPIYLIMYLFSSLILPSIFGAICGSLMWLLNPASTLGAYHVFLMGFSMGSSGLVAFASFFLYSADR